VIKTSKNRANMTSRIDETSISKKERFWKRILIIDDDADITTTFKMGIEDGNSDTNDKRIEVHTYNDPTAALSEFQPNFFDLLLVDINMPHMNGFQICEKILELDINVRDCFMSSGEINREALREIYPVSLGCFIKKPVNMDYLIERIKAELD
jgi:two-component system catabolic regulation response regulator CreB/two-component system response regulator ChvI